MDDYRVVLHQLAKLKFNRIFVSLWPQQPFLHIECRDVARNSAMLWYGFKYPITDDMPGRQLFDDRAEFWNPDLPLGASYEEFRTAGETLIRRLMEYAKSLGMDCVTTCHLTSFPAEFQQLPGHWRPIHQLGATCVVPGKDTSPTDPVLTELATTVLQTTLKTYPQTDYLAFGMPEWRQWADLYESAWKSLDAKYAVETVTPLAEVISAAEKRTGYPGGTERAVQEVKGDIVALYFYDLLLTQQKAISHSSKPEVRAIYRAVAEELFPVLSRILPAGAETLNFVDYTPARILKRQETLAAMGGNRIPASLIYTLHDDNVGLLPMLSTGSLHRLNVALGEHGWAGFSTRYWIVSDHDPCVIYLARASWNAEETPQGVYADLVENVCGKPCVDNMLEMFRELEEVTVLLELKLLGVTFPTPKMVRRQHLRTGPMSEECLQVREGYRRALAAARRARTNTRPAGEAFVDYWIGRLEFGVGYFDSIEAARHATTLEKEADEAEKAGQVELAKQKHTAAIEAMRDAVNISHSMLESYARVAQDQSDAGAIATMVEYVYRPLRAKLRTWTKE